MCSFHRIFSITYKIIIREYNKKRQLIKKRQLNKKTSINKNKLIK